MILSNCSTQSSTQKSTTIQIIGLILKLDDVVTCSQELFPSPLLLNEITSSKLISAGTIKDSTTRCFNGNDGSKHFIIRTARSVIEKQDAVWLKQQQETSQSCHKPPEASHSIYKYSNLHCNKNKHRPPSCKNNRLFIFFDSHNTDACFASLQRFSKSRGVFQCQTK